MRAAKVVIVIVMLFVASCASDAESAAHNSFTLVGSTACDAAIKSAMGIPADLKCDFIRWNIRIDPEHGNAFTLDANYGESQPNTLGFTGGGQRISGSGKFAVLLSARPQQAIDKRSEIYRLRSSQPAFDIQLVKINANLFHFVSADGAMLVGNGGWSYTLNRGEPTANAGVPATGFSSAIASRPGSTIFDGRTPCNGLGSIVSARPEDSCFKIKWRVTLDRDPSTLQPTTFSIKGIIPDRSKDIAGKWSEAKVPNSDATVLKLVPADGTPGVSLMIADENILFFLDAGGRPLVGNKDFSFTLNRKS